MEGSPLNFLWKKWESKYFFSSKHQLRDFVLIQGTFICFLESFFCHICLPENCLQSENITTTTYMGMGR